MKQLTRFVAFVLIPCLIADPNVADAFSQTVGTVHRFSPRSISTDLFNQQALVAGLMDWTQSLDTPARIRSIHQHPTYQRLHYRSVKAPRIRIFPGAGVLGSVLALAIASLAAGQTHVGAEENRAAAVAAVQSSGMTRLFDKLHRHKQPPSGSELAEKLRKRILSAAQRVSDHLSHGRWLGDENPNLLHLLRTQIIEEGNFDVTDLPSGEVFTLDLNQQHMLQFDKVDLDDMTDTELEMLLVHATAHLTPDRTNREWLSNYIRLHSPEHRPAGVRLKHYLALKIQNSVEAYRLQYIYAGHLAKVSERPAPIPFYFTLPTNSQGQLNEDRLRLILLRHFPDSETVRKNPLEEARVQSLQDDIKDLARKDGVDPTDPFAYMEWALGWLKNPDLYNLLGRPNQLPKPETLNPLGWLPLSWGLALLALPSGGKKQKSQAEGAAATPEVDSDGDQAVSYLEQKFGLVEIQKASQEARTGQPDELTDQQAVDVLNFAGEDVLEKFGIIQGHRRWILEARRRKGPHVFSDLADFWEYFQKVSPAGPVLRQTGYNERIFRRILKSVKTRPLLAIDIVPKRAASGIHAPANAEEALREIRRQIPYGRFTEKQLVILKYLYGLRAERLGHVIDAFPQVLGYSLEEKIKPTVAYLVSLGVERLGHVIDAFPQVLGLSLEEKIKPTVAYLVGLGVERLGHVIDAFPQVLGLSLEEKIKPTVAYLVGLGVERLGHVIDASPQVLGLSLEEKIKPTVAYLVSLGVERIGYVIDAFPPVLGLSLEEKIKPTVAYLVGLGVERLGHVIDAFPQVLGYSLEEKIKPTVQRLKRIRGDSAFDVREFISLVMKNLRVMDLLLDEVQSAGVLMGEVKPFVNFYSAVDKAIKRAIGQSAVQYLKQAEKQGPEQVLLVEKEIRSQAAAYLRRNYPAAPKSEKGFFILEGSVAASLIIGMLGPLLKTPVSFPRAALALIFFSLTWAIGKYIVTPMQHSRALLPYLQSA